MWFLVCLTMFCLTPSFGSCRWRTGQQVSKVDPHGIRCSAVLKGT